jgi:hypothetical protein
VISASNAVFYGLELIASPFERSAPIPKPQLKTWPGAGVAASVRKLLILGGASTADTHARGGVREPSGLPERFDLERDGDLVADDRAAGLERHIDVDTEVLAIEHD